MPRSPLEAAPFGLGNPVDTAKDGRLQLMKMQEFPIQSYPPKIAGSVGTVSGQFWVRVDD